MSLIDTLRFVVTHPLNRQRRARALLGYLKWQIGGRLAGKVLFHWVDGSKAIVRPGDVGFTGNIYAGLEEFPDMAFVLHSVGEGDLFVDVGANVGAYTILACAVRGARGYCFEPVPSTYARLVENIGVNGLEGRVRAFNVGIGDREEELVFATSRDDCTNHVIASGETAAGQIRVKTYPLDTMLGGESPSLLKVDVEGFETRVVDGARTLLQKETLHSVILELNGGGRRYGFDDDRLVATMGNFGFHPYAYDPFARRLQRLPGRNATSRNTLFIRNEGFVKGRIASAPAVSVRGIRF